MVGGKGGCEIQRETNLNKTPRIIKITASKYLNMS